MVGKPRSRRRIVFLFSDTGGGHRSATEAMMEAMDLEFPGVFETKKIDFFTEYYPQPLRSAPEIYPPMTRIPEVWEFSYRMFNGRRRSVAMNRIAYPIVRRAIRRLLRENPADVIVSVHPLVNAAVLRAMRRAPVPFVTVVTDMVTTHAFWYDRRADLIVVPTDQAKLRGIECGVPAQKMTVVGLPVAEKFRRPPIDPGPIRERLGWASDRPVILLVGGGDGMGPVARVAKAINEARLNASLAVICGRNDSLYARLSRVDWNMPIHLYGFVTDMPDFMAAADVLVTKAGPGTISEAFISGLPLVLYSRMPGQEDGNVSYVMQEDAGVWAPTPDLVVNALRRWVNTPLERARAAASSARVGRPDAAREIVRLIGARAGVFRAD